MLHLEPKQEQNDLIHEDNEDNNDDDYKGWYDSVMGQNRKTNENGVNPWSGRWHINIYKMYSWGKNSQPLSFLHGFVVSPNSSSRFNTRHFFLHFYWSSVRNVLGTLSGPL
jgi:hypothetical protein